jgi:hypothetical protein
MTYNATAPPTEPPTIAALFPWLPDPELEVGADETVGLAVGSWVTDDKVE